ncbi:unnamed protein product [Rhizophagus irregularis]|nr:unnamed protein product [Rhizophagus irregularis]
MADSVWIAVLSKQPFCTIMVNLEAQLLCCIKLNVFMFLEQDSERRFRVDSLSQVEWTAARNEKTRERFWEVEILNEDGKHVNKRRFA